MVLWDLVITQASQRFLPVVRVLLLRVANRVHNHN